MWTYEIAFLLIIMQYTSFFYSKLWLNIKLDQYSILIMMNSLAYDKSQR